MGIGVGVAVAGGGTLYAVGYHFWGLCAIAGGGGTALISVGALVDLAFEHRAPVNLPYTKVASLQGPGRPLSKPPSLSVLTCEYDGALWEVVQRYANGDVLARPKCPEHLTDPSYRSLQSGEVRVLDTGDLMRDGALLAGVGEMFCPFPDAGEGHGMGPHKSKSYKEAERGARSVLSGKWLQQRLAKE
jgi:hypothetical protein